LLYFNTTGIGNAEIRASQANVFDSKMQKIPALFKGMTVSITEK
jgi:hypothetical protein